ncbi:DUF5916 domain-containing protein [Spongiivirga citrea]|uniref:DUF5916 domain-containing protein n=1 Tax=Spongiivirga citrea TaxID=1481457 RepID=A0A6M0CKV7_9FLAO|nr:DUF5916 domain-containing protein [Spongiivirga citrea]NER16624.1 hypothetical protein [Spongiivirga citrea]
MSRIIITTLFFLFFSRIHGQNSEITFHDLSITLDGKLDETIWKDLPEYTNFHNYLPSDEGLAEQQTKVKIFHNGEYLFVSAIYQDNETRAQISSLKRDDLSNTVVGSETFVLILDTQHQQQSAYYFAVNIGAAQVDGLIERVNDGFSINTNWNTVWNAKTTTKGTNKHYEIAIPLKNLNFKTDNDQFGIQFYVRDIKKNSWTIFKDVSRNYRLFDLRFTESFRINNLPENSNSRFAVTPSVTINHQEDVLSDIKETTFQPSLDVQYNLTSSLKLDATINPDFSQIDVDQQVTNFTRFSIFFPERRNFFLENADLFSNLGIEGINPFYSRRIGSRSAIQFGLKLSGNVSPKTRIGVLNVQTEKDEDEDSQNYAVLVGEQQLSNNFTATGFLINRQQTDNFNFVGNYNRVAGANLNYKSTNNRWIGLANIAKSYSNGEKGDSNFYHAGIWYNKRGMFWNASLRTIGRNYLTDVGFTPRLFNFDAINQTVVREGYTQATARISLTKFFQKSKKLNSYRYFLGRTFVYWDEQGKLQQTSSFLNQALFFKNLSAMYISLYHDYVNLKYGFDPLRNGNVLVPDEYSFLRARIGFNSATNNKLVYRTFVQYGQFYNGTNTTASASFQYRLLPFANLQAAYEINYLDLNELGKDTFHLARFTGEVFFNNRLNWTTYVQYNTQIDNFNINSRLQWEYRPLSYVYLVVTDNFNQQINRTNWGVAFKMNYRLDF